MSRTHQVLKPRDKTVGPGGIGSLREITWPEGPSLKEEKIGDNRVKFGRRKSFRNSLWIIPNSEIQAVKYRRYNWGWRWGKWEKTGWSGAGAGDSRGRNHVGQISTEGEQTEPSSDQLRGIWKAMSSWVSPSLLSMDGWIYPRPLCAPGDGDRR